MREITYEPTYQHEWVVGGDVVKLPINVTKKSGCYVEILEAIIRELVAMLSIHSKVLAVRFDVSLHDYTSDNGVISRFLKSLRRWIERNYNSKLGYVWVREHDTAKKQHYHFLVIVNGDKACLASAYKIFERAEKIAEIQQQHISRIWRCKDNTMVRRGDTKAFGKVIERGSYLAKERTKGKHKGVYSNNYSGSEIKPNSEKLPLVMPKFNRPVLELTMCEPIITKTRTQGKPLTKRTIRKHKAVNDAQLDLFAVA
ncbi:YagK/YfjJ domain-containing protein [Listeria innocua]|uniref:YagK/YfjJ domain-containing protein n=1 Tax=Listeria innocua TaxID=1642 RepID=UPI0019442825|nr:inovirus-type Gp2 protein [Listeria innocua]